MTTILELEAQSIKSNRGQQVQIRLSSSATAKPF